MRLRIPVWTLSCHVLFLAVGFATPAPAQHPKTEYLIQGRVYNGEVGDQSSPIEGVTVAVYGSNNPHPDQGTLIQSVTTNSEGWYGLSFFDDDGFWAFYHVVETDPGGFDSVGATTVDGIVRTANWIEFAHPLDGLDLTGNKFWDRLPDPATATPTPTPSPTSTPTPTPTRSMTSTPTATPTPSSHSISVCAVADTFVNDGNPTGNFGSEPFLEMGYGAGPGELHTRRTLVRFDLSFAPPGSRVDDAWFELEQIGAVGLTTVSVDLYNVIDPWDEHAVTWDDQPAISSPAVSQTTVHSSQSVSGWNVRQLVQDWIDDPGANNGLGLRGPESGIQWTRRFRTRHSSQFCPRLVIDFVGGTVIGVPTPTPTPSPTPTSAPVCPQPDGAGDSFATAAPLTASTPVTEYICPSGDVDWWKIPLEHGQEVQVFLSDLPTGPAADYDVFLYDPTGAERAASAIFGAHKGGYLSHVSTITGEWRILVRGKGVADWSKTHTYRLRADTSFPCASADEAGNSFSQATPLIPSVPQASLSRPVYGYLCPSGDRDFYSFHAPGGNETIEITLTELAADFDLALYLPNGSKIDSRTSTGTSPEILTIYPTGIPGEWRVEVYGKGGTTYHGHPYKLEVAVSSDADLTVRAVEITQGIQDLNHSVPLIKGKPVWARVYLDIGKASGPVGDVRLELAGWAFDDFGATSKLPGSPLKLGPFMIKDPPAVLDTAQRRQLTAESSIVLPAAWLENGPRIRLRAEVNPDKTVPESDFSNNVLLVEAGDVLWKKPVHLYFVPIKAAGKVPSLSSASLKDVVMFFEAVMPIPDAVLHFAKKPVSADYDYTATGGGACGSGWSDLLDDLGSLGNWVKWFAPPHSFVFGVLHTDVQSHAGGCGVTGGNVAAGQLWQDSGATVAHEVGHNFGRRHTPCGVTGDGIDYGYPTYTDPQGKAYFRGSIGEVGVHVLDPTRLPRDPFSSADFMGYCGDKWASPHTYRRIMDGLSTAKTATFKESGTPHLAISGRIVEDTVQLRSIWTLNMDGDDTAEHADGPFSLQQRDAEDIELSVRSFDPFYLCGAEDHACGFFSEAMPLIEGTAEIRVLRAEEVLKSVLVSPNPPEVEVSSPNGGETWDGDGPFTVSWTATDADGDPLTATVLYSADGGSWEPIAVELEGNAVEVDGSLLAGGDRSRVRVIVTDGFNTTEDDSDGVFSVSRKNPSVLLLRPSTGELVGSDRQLLVHGLANDPEDGPLTDGALFWRSDRDGDLGTGGTLTVDGLSCGSHVITLEAADSDGMSSFETTVVTALGGCNDYLLVIPATANSTGALGTHWVTDAVIHNPGSESATVYLYLLVKKGDPRLGPGLTVPAGQSIKLIDIVAAYFGEHEVSGAVLVASSGHVQVSTRTFNDAAAGTLGQYTPGHLQIEAVTGSRRAMLIQLSRTDRYRTNIGFANTTWSPLAVHIEIFDSAGVALGRRNKTVDPWGYLQVNDVIGKITADHIQDAFAVVWSNDPDAEYFTYASVVDNGSGDPIYIAPVTATDGELYLPSAAHNPGVNSTLWRTDLEVCNPDGGEAEFRIDLLEAGADNRSPQSAAFRLQPGTCRRYSDAVALFQYEGSGSLRVVPSIGKVAATARTYNDLGDRSFGQYIPPWPDEKAIEAGEQVRLVQLAQSPGRDTGSRTNLGFVSAVGQPIDLTIDLFYGDGGYIGRTSVHLKPYGFRQLTEPIKKLTDADVLDAFALIRSDTEGARYLAYASVIDNLSGDPVYIPAARR